MFGLKDSHSHEEEEKDLEKDSTVVATPRERSTANSTHSDHDGLEKQDQGADDGALERVESNMYPGPAKLIPILLAVTLSIFLVALDMTIIATALPRITSQFHSITDIGWYGSAFFLTLAAFQSTWGKAYKYFPLKWSFLLAIAIFELGSLICAVAPSSTALIVGRAIAGVGGAGVSSGVYTILAFSVPPARVAAYTGLLGASYAIASAVGPLLGGVFTSDVTWRWCFYINLPIGGLVVAMIYFSFHAPKAATVQQATMKEKILQLDLVGSFLIMAAAVCLILALQWGGATKSWGSADVIGTLVGFGLIVILFIINEWWMDERALLVPRLLRKKTLRLMSAYVLFNCGGFFVLLYYLPIYFQSIEGVSASESGVHNVPLILSISLMSIASGVFIMTTGHYSGVIIFASILAVVGDGLIYTLGIGSPSSQWIGYQVLAGIGYGISIQVPIIVAQGTSDPSDISSVSAIVLFFQVIGGAIFISMAEALFTNKLVQSAQHVAGVSAAKIVATGATQLKTTFPNHLLAVRKAYLAGLKDAFIFSIALAGVGAVLAIGTLILDNRNLKVKKEAEAVTEAEKE